MTEVEKNKSMISINFDIEKQPVDLGKECPQVFTRKGTLRKPKATIKVRRSATEIVKLWQHLKAISDGIQLVDEMPAVRFVTHERIDVVLRGEVALQFLQREDNGLLDAIGAGWTIFVE